MDGSAAIRSGLYTKLKAATALSYISDWYQGVAPESAAIPYGILQLAAGGDTNQSPLDMVDDLWDIKTVDTNAARAEQSRGYIRDTLHNASFALGTGWILWDCQHEGPPFHYDEMVASVQHWHSGSTYRLRAHEDIS